MVFPQNLMLFSKYGTTVLLCICKSGVRQLFDIMSIECWWNMRQGKTQGLKEKCVYHKSYMDYYGTEPKCLQWIVSNYGPVL